MTIDPYYGSFRLYNWYELNESLLTQNGRLPDFKLGSLLVDTDSESYHEIVGLDPVRTAPWFQNAQGSNSPKSSLKDLTELQLPEPSETYRMIVSDDLSYNVDSKLLDYSNVSHHKVYFDHTLRQPISVASDVDDAVESGDRGALLLPLHEGDVAHYTAWDAANNVMFTLPLIVSRTNNVIDLYPEAPIDVRLEHSSISLSDPRIIDLRNKPYVKSNDFNVRLTYSNGRSEVVNLDDSRMEMVGLMEAYYGDLPQSSIQLIYYHTADKSARFIRRYTVLLTTTPVPDIEPIPEPPRVDVYHTSRPYPVVVDDTDIIRSSARVNGELTVKRSVFSTSVIYPITVVDDSTISTASHFDGNIKTLNIEIEQLSPSYELTAEITSRNVRVSGGLTDDSQLVAGYELTAEITSRNVRVSGGLTDDSQLTSTYELTAEITSRNVRRSLDVVDDTNLTSGYELTGTITTEESP